MLSDIYPNLNKVRFSSVCTCWPFTCEVHILRNLMQLYEIFGALPHCHYSSKKHFRNFIEMFNLSERSLTTSGIYLSRNATLIPSDYLFNNCRYHNHRPCVRLPHRLPWKCPFKHSLPRVKFSARDWTLNQEIQRKGYTKVLLLICPEKMQDLHAI